LDDYGRGTIELLIDREVTRKQQIDRIEEEASPLRKVRPIALYCQRVSAGSGQLLIDDIPPEIINIPDTRENRHVTFAINVCGSSMEPAFSDGDIVLVEKTPAIDTGEIGIFFIDGNSYIKKLGKEELISLNPAYENIPLNDTARCMGRVVGKL